MLLRFAHLPEVDTDAEDAASSESNAKKTSIWQFPHLILGVIALFFYVGVEVIAGDSIIRYGQSIGIAMESAKYFTSLTLLGMIIGYTCGIIFIPKYFSQVTALKACTILGVIFSLGAILTPAHLVFTIPFIDIMTFKSIELVLPVTVLFVALARSCQCTGMAGNVASDPGRTGKIHKNRFCTAGYGNCRWRITALTLWQTCCHIFNPDCLLDMCTCIPYNNVLCFYRS